MNRLKVVAIMLWAMWPTVTLKLAQDGASEEEMENLEKATPGWFATMIHIFFNPDSDEAHHICP